MAEWKKYINTKEINDEMANAKGGWIAMDDCGVTGVRLGAVSTDIRNIMTHYLLCNPQPHAEMQAIWAKTGQPVEWQDSAGEWKAAWGNPSWHIDTKYRFAQPKKEVIYYRDYLYRRSDGIPRKTSLHEDPANGPEIIETGSHFIKWLDDEWKELEV